MHMGWLFLETSQPIFVAVDIAVHLRHLIKVLLVKADP